jgi:hypothetical protein
MLPVNTVHLLTATLRMGVSAIGLWWLLVACLAGVLFACWYATVIGCHRRCMCVRVLVP